MERRKERTVEFHEKQGNAFFFGTQFGAAIAGVQSGKTFVGAHWSHKMFLECRGDGLIGAPSYKILMQSTLQKFFKEFPYLRQYYRQAEQVIRVEQEDGTVKQIFLRSFDDPYSVEGVTLDWAWLDEAGQMKSDAWLVIKARVSTTGGRVLITTTPYNMGWLYQEVYLPWQRKEDERISVFTWKSVENPHFDPAFYEAERRALSPADFKKRYEGEFTRMMGLVYEIEPYHILKRKEMEFERVIGGIDWGWKHAALSVVGIRPEGAYIIGEWAGTEQKTRDIIDAAKQLQELYGVNRWYADSANPEKIAEAKEGTGLYVLPYQKKKDSIEHGVLHIGSMFNERRLFLFEDLKHHLGEFESYHYPDEMREGKRELPVKENDHFMDAMRYAIMGDAPARRGRYRPSSWRKQSTFEKMEARQPKREATRLGCR